jgi:hypothetical protein
MAIALVGSAASGEGPASATATWNVTRPTLSVGDVCLVLLTYDNNNLCTITPPTNWVELGANSYNANCKVTVLRKVWDGTEANPLVFTFSGSGAFGAWATIAYSGVDGTTPEDTTTTSYNDGGASDLTPQQTAQTTVTDNAMLVGFWGQRNYADSPNTAGGGATERLEHPKAVAMFMYIEDKVKTPTGSEGLTFTANSSTFTWQGVQVALRPAASGLTPPYVSVSVA